MSGKPSKEQSIGERKRVNGKGRPASEDSLCRTGENEAKPSSEPGNLLRGSIRIFSCHLLLEDSCPAREFKKIIYGDHYSGPKK